jgi:hypothetical protein
MSETILIPASTSASASTTILPPTSAYSTPPLSTPTLLDRLSSSLNSLSLSDLEKVALFTNERVLNLKREEENKRLEELKRREAIETDEILKLNDKLIHALKNRKSETDIPELQELYEVLSGYRFSPSRYGLYDKDFKDIRDKDRDFRNMKDFKDARDRASKFISMNTNKR